MILLRPHSSVFGPCTFGSSGCVFGPRASQIAEFCKPTSDFSSYHESHHLRGLSQYRPGPGEVQGVDEAEGGGAGRAARGQVADEVAPELLVLVDAAEEDLLELVLEGEVKGLGGEVADHVGRVAAPVSQHALLPRDADEAVDHA